MQRMRTGADVASDGAMPAPPPALPASAQRVQEALAGLRLGRRVVALPVAARTSHQAADALGVEVGRIAKSPVFGGDREVEIG
jgi:hypothetical protein